jgi:hypothetical protein
VRTVPAASANNTRGGFKPSGNGYLDRERTFPLQPVAVVIAVVGGVALLVGSMHKRT